MPGVQLRTVRYSERLGRAKEWTLDGLTLGSVNLLVGRNATGKTRSLNVIGNLARMLTPEARYRTANAGYDLHFDHNGADLHYILLVEDGQVRREEVRVAGELLLERDADGGRILMQEDGKKVRFRPPPNELAVIARQDSLQHPFLEPLQIWARAVRHYTFGASLGKHHVAFRVNDGPEADDRDANQVVGIFRKAKELLGPDFVAAVIRDMSEVHYHLDGIDVYAPADYRVLRDGVPTEVLALGVRERGVSGVVDQNEMSQGMFRALSILIQVNYLGMAHRAGCLIIDDIGEGLDFERSTRLIEILRAKARAASFQLVMSTNDQFVMNSIPLDEWSVLQRDGCHVRVFNRDNAPKAFDDFKFIGMSNFTFFEMDFAGGAGHE